MANYSDKTRREQVFAYLRAHEGEWVDGPDLANETVGGSEGLKRLRELRADGEPIQVRRHPDPARDIFQYRYVLNQAPSPVRQIVPVDEAGRFISQPRRIPFGAAESCPRCKHRTRLINIPGSTIPVHRDPDGGGACTRCNGWGLIPSAAYGR